MTRGRALVCFYDVPRIDRDSGSRNVFDFVTFLVGAGYETFYVAVNGISDRRDAASLQQHGVAVFDDATSLEELLGLGHFDLALLCPWTIAELYMPVIRRVSPTTRVLVNSLDLHFLRDARRILGGPESVSLDEDFASQLIGELNVYAAADLALTVSTKEAELINDLAGAPDLAHTVPDTEALFPSPLSFDNRRGMVFIGGYRHPPNVQAVEFLCREVLPRVDPALLEQHPAYILGDGLDDNVRAFGEGMPNVRMIGWVPSVIPYLHQSRIAVIPLLYGAGTKRKMLEALMTGTPAVTTSIGMEGLGLLSGEHVLAADEANVFARSIERLLSERELWERLALAGRDHVMALHSRDVGRTRFLAAVDHALAKEPKGRLLRERDRDFYMQRLAYQDRARVEAQQDTAGNGLRERIEELVPSAATVIVVSRGDDALLKLNGREAWHFPQMADGTYAGHHPADSAEAIAHLETLRVRGARYLVFPATSRWWLNHYEELRRHLERNYREVLDDPHVCSIWALEQLGDQAKSRPGYIDITERDEPPESDDPRLKADVRAIAFFLPQYHPIPENDRWWGKGFTEWTNVSKAAPQFPGHYQPHLPSELGFYDLRLAEVRAEQAELARAHRIHGFCYYHYWFEGKRLLERPFEEVLRSGEPDFPFCLCWANEPWARRWDGRNHDVLQAQSYGDADDLRHITALLPALQDRRAITVEGKPLFLIYQGRELPDAGWTLETWRREADAAGLPGLYLVAVETGWDAGWDATQVGFDAKVLFQPQFSTLRQMPSLELADREHLKAYDYDQAWPTLANPDPVGYRRYDSVFTSWDNTARRGDQATVVHNSTPEAYEKWLRHVVARAREQPLEHRIVFINAWNEWAEGAHLEPDMRHGRAYLEATRRALAPRADAAPDSQAEMVDVLANSVRAAAPGSNERAT